MLCSTLYVRTHCSILRAKKSTSVPYGCSVWPAFWVHGAEWPSGGEIDIFEGVNMQPSNQVALHTVTGCYAGNGTMMPTGQLISNNCDHLVNGNQGCTVLDGRNQSYGPGFASAGGGVYAMELASSGISVWFFPVSTPVYTGTLNLLIRPPGLVAHCVTRRYQVQFDFSGSYHMDAAHGLLLKFVL